MRNTLPLILAALAGSGCAYIGQVEFEQKRASLDQDKDGAPLDGPGKDCDDHNPKVAPGLEEIPYDGLDNDCAGGDVVDLDGDRYPGILKADYLAQFPDAEWPADVLEGPVDCADDPAIHANAAQIYPGNITDEEYDGIDADCGGDNDFDADGDGYMPDAATVNGVTIDVQQAFDDYVALWGYDHLVDGARFGDCNDFRAAANPGVDPANDAWYDGHDDDCAGNNDFDADGDGYMPNLDPFSGDPLDALYTDFVEAYYPDGAPWTEQWDDCLDQPHPTLPDLLPADVWPGNPNDPPYDGIDADCACDNDFDADGDGFMRDGDDAGFATYLAAWGCTGLPELYGDCDDQEATTYPGALERLGDPHDSDCELGPDATPFGFDDAIWASPRTPRVVRTDNHYIVVTGSDYVDILSLSAADVGMSLAFALDSGYDAPLANTPTQWQGVTTRFPLSTALDAMADGTDFNATISYNYTLTTFATYLQVKHVTYVPPDSYVSSWAHWTLTSNGYIYDATAVNAVMDSDGYPWALSCGPESIQVVRGGSYSIGAEIAPGGILYPSGVPSGVCFFNGDPIPTQPSPGIYEGTAEVVVCDPGVDCETWVFDASTASLSPAPVNSWSGWALDYGRYRDGWFILLETGQPGATIIGPDGTSSVLDNWTVSNVDAYWRDLNTSGTGPPDWHLYVAAVAEPLVPDGQGPRVVLAWGEQGLPLDEAVLPYDNPDIPDQVPTGVGIHADDNRLVLAVSAERFADDMNCDVDSAYPYNTYCLDDSIGWVFFGWP